MESRCRSRSPLPHNESRPKSGRSSPAPSNASASSTNSNSSKRESLTKFKKYQLKLSNVPIHWKWHNVAGYIKKICQVDRDIANDVSFIWLKLNQAYCSQDAYISFKNDYRRNQAFEQLKRTYEKVDGQKLYVTKNGEGSSTLEKSIQKAPKDSGQLAKFACSKRITQYYNDALIVENTETYGLSVDYLKELHIKPPLIRKIFVRSLPDQYKDEEKARSLFGQAGLVVSLVILSKGVTTNARVEYDHPVEAVQAISMFHDREIFGRKMSCEMDCMKKIWTDGMPVQGPGLGPNGSPLRGARLIVEIKKVKAEFMKEFKILSDSVDELKVNVLSLLNASISTKQISTNIDNMPLLNASNPLINASNPLINTSNPLINASNPLINASNSLINTSNPLINASNPLLNVANPLGPNSLAALGNIFSNQLPIQLLQSLVQQNSGNDLGVLGNALQNLTGSNISNLLQKAQSNNQSGDSNMQGGHNMQVGSNMQSGSNMLGGLNMQGGPSNDMTAGSFNNIQRGPSNMQSGPNNMPSGSSNMQTGPNNMQSGSNNMQSGSKNMQSGSNNIQSGPNNMQRGSNNMETGHNNAQRGPNMQSGYLNTQSGPSNEMANIHLGSNMQHVNQNAFGSNSHTFTPPMQQGSSNVQGFHYNNVQLGSSNTGPNQQMNRGFAGSPFNSNNTQNMTGNSSAMLLFRNLPVSVTLPALQAKMAEVGDVNFIQITGPGRALINFSSDQDADKCVALFNHSKVDGQMIEVKKM